MHEQMPCNCASKKPGMIAGTHEWHTWVAGIQGGEVGQQLGSTVLLQGVAVGALGRETGAKVCVTRSQGVGHRHAKGVAEVVQHTSCSIEHSL